MKNPCLDKLVGLGFQRIEMVDEEPLLEQIKEALQKHAYEDYVTEGEDVLKLEGQIFTLVDFVNKYQPPLECCEPTIEDIESTAKVLKVSRR